MRTQFMEFCSPINLSLLACSWPSIRLVARTEAMPAWGEGYERAAKKRLAVERVDRRTQSAAPNSLDSAPQRPQFHSRASHHRSRRQQTPRCTKARGRTAFIDPHIACWQPRVRMRDGARQPSPQQKQRLSNTPAGEHARNAIARRTAVARRSRKKNAQHP